MLIYCLIFVYLFDLFIASVYNILHVTLLKLGVRICKINFYNIYKYVKHYQYFLLPWVDRVHFHSINIQLTREKDEKIIMMMLMIKNYWNIEVTYDCLWSSCWLFFVCVWMWDEKKSVFIFVNDFCRTPDIL